MQQRGSGRLPPGRMYPAGESGITVQYVTLDDGLKIRVLESGPPTSEAVLLLHGWAACVYSFSEMIPALSDAGFRTVAIDLPGHGLSDKPADEARYTTRALTDVVRAIADAMGVGRFSLVGHSLGGALGLDIAISAEPRLERLVLINSVGLGTVVLHPLLKLLSPRVLNPVLPSFITRSNVKLVLRMAYAAPEWPRERDIDQYWAPSQFDGYAWACRACVHQVTWGKVSATKLRSLRVPVLVITGGRDILVRGNSERARLIPGAQVVNIREGGHVVLQECAAKANAEILRFLRG